MIRSITLAVVLVASASACAKKKAPMSPANAAPTESAGGASEGSEVKDENKPDDPDDAQKMNADPCDGGE